MYEALIFKAQKIIICTIITTITYYCNAFSTAIPPNLIRRALVAGHIL